MKKSSSIILLVAFLMIIVGVTLSLVGFLVFGGKTLIAIDKDGVRMPGERTEHSFTTAIEPITSIEVLNSHGNLRIEEGEGYKFAYVTAPRYYEPATREKVLSDYATVVDGKLVIDYQLTGSDESTFYFGLDTSGPVLGSDNVYQVDEIVITVPKGTNLDEISFNSSGYTVELDRVSAKKLVTSDLRGQMFVVGGSYGEMDLAGNGAGLTLNNDIAVSGALKTSGVFDTIHVEKANLGTADIEADNEIFLNQVKVLGAAKLESNNGFVNTQTSEFMAGLDASASGNSVLIHGAVTGPLNVTDVSWEVIILSTLPKASTQVHLVTEEGNIMYNKELMGKDFKEVNQAATSTINVNVKGAQVYVYTDADSRAPEGWDINDTKPLGIEWPAPNEWEVQQ